MIKIIRYGILALLATLMSACALTPAEEGDIPDRVVQWSMDNVWRVHVSNGSGTGFAYDDNTLVTACHVVQGSKVAAITNARDTQLIFLEVISCNETSDIAILKTRFEEDSLNSTPQILGNVKFGKGVWGAGHPLGMHLLITKGHMGSSRVPNNQVTDSVFISSPTIFGDSGGPAIALVKGRIVVIGLRVAIRAVPIGFSGVNIIPHLTVVSPASNILKALND